MSNLITTIYDHRLKLVNLGAVTLSNVVKVVGKGLDINSILFNIQKMLKLIYCYMMPGAINAVKSAVTTVNFNRFRNITSF